MAPNTINPIVAVKLLEKMFILVLVFAALGWFLAKVGPKTPLNGSGSKNGAERSTMGRHRWVAATLNNYARVWCVSEVGHPAFTGG